MIGKLREIAARVRSWWDSLDSEDPEPLEEEQKFLTFFQGAESSPLPRPVQQVLAVGAVAAIVGFAGTALMSLSGLLFSLFVIYLLVTEVLGLEFDIDPRFWQAL